MQYGEDEEPKEVSVTHQIRSLLPFSASLVAPLHAVYCHDAMRRRHDLSDYALFVFNLIARRLG